MIDFEGYCYRLYYARIAGNTKAITEVLDEIDRALRQINKEGQNGE